MIFGRGGDVGSRGTRGGGRSPIGAQDGRSQALPIGALPIGARASPPPQKFLEAAAYARSLCPQRPETDGRERGQQSDYPA